FLNDSTFGKFIFIGGRSRGFFIASRFSNLDSNTESVFRSFFCLFAKYGFAPFILASELLICFGFLVSRCVCSSFCFLASFICFFSFCSFSNDCCACLFFCLFAKYGFAPFILASELLICFGFLVARCACSSFCFMASSNCFFSLRYFSNACCAWLYSTLFCSV